MSQYQLSDLIFPDKSVKTLPALRLHYLKETLRAFLRAGETLPLELKKTHRQIKNLVAKALAGNPQAVLDCFAVPTVGVLIHCHANKGRWPQLSEKISSAFQNALPHLLLEMALRHLMAPGEVFEWKWGAPRLASSSIQALLIPPPDASGWKFMANSISVLGGQGEGASLRLSSQSLTRGRREVQGLRSELSYVPLAGNIYLALKDLNPIAETEAHPGKFGNALSLGEHSEDDWRSSLQMALDWIKEATPEIFSEMQILLRHVVPVGFDPQRHFSASYQEAVGVVYMSLHPNPLVMAEALIHEFQHNKLYLASYRDGLLENAFHPLYPSPVRPDPRPLWGVLLAVHAFLPVAIFYRRLREINHPISQTPEFKRRLKEIVRQNKEGLETLGKHAQWTEAGKDLWKGLLSLEARASSSRAIAT